MFRSCKSSVPARSSFDKFKARPGPKCWYPSLPEARKVQKMEGSSPPEARKTEARHITNLETVINTISKNVLDKNA